MDPRMNIPAAEKMAYLTAGGNPVGVGKGRGAHLWGILMSLSLVVCHTISLHPKNSPSSVRQSPGDECGKYLQIILEEQGKTNTPAYPAPADCTNGRENGYCILNGTR